MRVFLRNKKTRLYCGTRKEWAALVSKAQPFSSVRQAARFAFAEKVPEAEIVVRCDVLQQEVTLPLLAEWCELPQPRSAPG
jgi:hypothetical protein